MRAILFCGWLFVVASSAAAQDMVMKPKFPLGRSTTFVTGPLDADGYVDYAAALNLHYGRGVTSAGNGAARIWSISGPVRTLYGAVPPGYYEALGIDAPADEGDYFVPFSEFVGDRIQYDAVKYEEYEAIFEKAAQTEERPWKRDEHPLVAAWLKHNASSLTRFEELSRLPHYYQPLLSPPAEAGKHREWLITPLVSQLMSIWRDVARAMQARAMLRLGEGEYDSAWQDLQTCRRVGRLIGRGPALVGGMIGMTIDSLGSAGEAAFVAVAKVSDEDYRRYRRDLDRLPPFPAFADKVDLAERFLLLDTVRLLSQGDITPLGSILEGTDAPTEEMLRNLQRVDFVPTLEVGNRWCDRMVAAMRLPTRGERKTAIEKVVAEVNALNPKSAAESALLLRRMLTVPSDDFDAQLLGELLVSSFCPSIAFTQNLCDAAELKVEMTRIALALAAYRNEHAAYPGRLESLVPQWLPNLPHDAFSDRPLVYRPQANGYLMYSVGIDGRDDGGKNYYDEKADVLYDDLAIEVPLPSPTPPAAP